MQNADNAKAARKEHEPAQHQLSGKVKNTVPGVKPVRELLHVPADPAWQGAILVIIVHRGEVPPGMVSARKLHHARFEIDPEPFPSQQKQARARRRIPSRQAPDGMPGGAKKRRDESPPRAASRRTGSSKNPAPCSRKKQNRQSKPRASRAATGSRPITATRPAPPSKPASVPGRLSPTKTGSAHTRSAGRGAHRDRLQIVTRRQNPVRPVESLDLKQE